MRLINVLMIIVVIILIIIYEWPKIDEGLKKEKRAFVIVTIGAVLLAVLLIYIPEMPGPTELVDWILGPLAILESQ
ncbi:hypothetical protein [Virgibacillus sp. L01]|uniref:hypothetical protein n=1 Tax=Virgibacillus sp. L01 TaxID=3457429 RepID=UPI003FD471B6